MTSYGGVKFSTNPYRPSNQNIGMATCPTPARQPQQVTFHSSTLPQRNKLKRGTNSSARTTSTGANQRPSARAVDDYHVAYRRKPVRPGSGVTGALSKGKRSSSADRRSGTSPSRPKGGKNPPVPHPKVVAMDSGPWIPAPGRTTKAGLCSAVKMYSSLDSTPERDTTPGGGGRVKLYEQRIEGLMNEVDELRDQMERDKDQTARTEDDEEESTITENLQQKKGNIALQSSLGQLAMTSPSHTAATTGGSPKDDSNYDDETITTITPTSTARTESSQHLLQSTRNIASRDLPLVKALFEAELASETASKASQHFLLQIERGRADLAATSQLIDGIAYFDEVCVELGRVVRQTQAGIGEEKTAGGRKLAATIGGEDKLIQAARDLERINTRLREQLDDKERQLEEMGLRMTSQHDESLNFTTMQESLESTRAHLQKQLRQKEGDCNRMAVQIRGLEGHLAQARVDQNYLSGVLEQQKGRIDEEKEALKKATRAQRQRTVKAEQLVETLTQELMERDAYIATIVDTVEPEKEFQTFARKTTKEPPNRNGTEIDNLKEENEKLRQIAKSFEQRASKSDIEVTKLREELAQGESSKQKEEPTKDAVSGESKLGNDNFLKEKLEIAENEREKAIEKQREMEELCREAKNKIREGENRIRDSENRLKCLEEENRDLKNHTSELNDRLRQSDNTNHGGQSFIQISSRDSQNRSLQQQPKGRQSSSLENQVTQLRTEVSRLRSEKEGTDRRSESRLNEIRLQLDQSESSSRSMQAYIHFLKKSYANVFTEGEMPGLPFERFEANYA